MRKRRNALVCLLAACLMAVTAPAEALAQEVKAEAGQQGAQETLEEESAGKETAGILETENETPEENGTATVQPKEEAAEKEPETEPEAKEEERAADNGFGQPEEKRVEEEPEESAQAVSEDVIEEEPKEAAEEEPEEEIIIDPEDPGKYRLEGQGTGDFSSSGLRAQAVSHQAKYKDCILQRGIDVSYHNGTINWNKVKEDGIDFAIIRVAYRGYENGKLKMDTQALKNMKDANEAGVPIGVYIFSQAVSEAEARQEADYIVKNIQGYKIDLPVVLDFEYVAVGVGRLYKAKLSKNEATGVCVSFCDRVKALGYTPMVYASKSMYEDKTYAADFSQEYPIWMAHYNNSTSYAGEYEYWQYTSTGKVKGIGTKSNKYVDLNYRYYNTLRITDRTAGSISMKWDAWDGAGSYDIYRKSGSGYTMLASGVNGTEFTDKSLKAGKDYSYKVYPHGTKTCIGFNTGITRLASSAKISGKGAAFDKIKLNWTKISGVTYYYIERYNSSKKAYSNIKQASKKTASFTDKNKNASTTYKYRMRPCKVVFNGRAFGEYSKVVSAKTKGKVKAKTKAKKIKLRKSASKSSKSLGTIKKKGTSVKVTGSNGSWYRISVKIKGKNRTGYIKKSNIKLLK